MAISEYREFFTRNVQKNTGGYPDKEAGFPIKEYVIDQFSVTTEEYNRFLKKHFPSQDVFEKFFESIAFKLNDEDTSTTEAQGLVRIAIGESITTRTDGEDVLENTITKTFTTVVVPSTLPIVSAGTNVSIVTKIRRSSDNVVVGSITPGDRNLYYLDYEISATGVDNINDVDGISEIQGSTLTEIGSGVLTGHLIVNDKVLSADTLKASYDYLDIDFDMNEQIVSRNFGTLKLAIGADADPNNRHIISFPNYSTLGATDPFTRKCNVKIYRIAADAYTIVFEAFNYTASRVTATDPAIGDTVAVTGTPVSDGAQSAGTNARSYYRLVTTSAIKVDWTSGVNIALLLSLDGETKASYSTRRFSIQNKVVNN